ncbi:hypothetical protein [Variovorax sp. J31P207]|uniref:hypothetical protein n=1 Tax=Variovorax sp. J31P207 TaxID=3053510 RepID=UPI0025783E36|nr:hypothetical protein [Variovorax sp. J31P207]MDM0071617.1 hypothetical protein [Variovorax sp. J31P207]
MLQASIAAGSEYMGMEPLVSCDPRSGIPHGTWRRRKIAQGEPVSSRWQPAMTATTPR